MSSCLGHLAMPYRLQGTDRHLVWSGMLWWSVLKPSFIESKVQQVSFCLYCVRSCCHADAQSERCPPVSSTKVQPVLSNGIWLGRYAVEHQNFVHSSVKSLLCYTYLSIFQWDQQVYRNVCSHVADHWAKRNMVRDAATNLHARFTVVLLTPKRFAASLKL